MDTKEGKNISRRDFLNGASILTGAALISACTNAPTPGATQQETSALSSNECKKFVIGGLAKSYVPFWEESHIAIDEVCKRMGGELVWQNPTNEDVAKQKQFLEGFISQGVNGILFAASDPNAFTDIVQTALQKKIPVVMWEADATPSGRLLYVGGDDYRYGYKAGEALAKKLGGKGKVVIMQASATASNAIGRANGMEDALKKGGCEVVARDLDQEDAMRVQAHAENYITTYPDLRGFSVVYGAYQLGQVVAAVKSSGKIGQIEITGCDPYGDAYEGIRDGSVFMAFQHSSYDMGAIASMWLCNCIKYGAEHAYYLAGVDPATPIADRKIVIPDVQLTKDNMDAYINHIEELKKGNWGVDFETWI